MIARPIWLVSALAGQDADDREGDVLDAHFLAERRFVREQVARDRLAEQADLAAVAHIAVGEGLARGQFGPLAHGQELRRGAVDDRP